MIDLWVEKYRPKTIDDYVWTSESIKQKVLEWVDLRCVPHLLLSGKQGTGKTSLAKLLLSLMNIPNSDILEINASSERKIEDLQEKIINFAATWALNETGFKYVLLDEADSLSQLSQRFLRAEMEKYHDSCRFILTCNYRNKILPALHSRLHEISFQSLDKDEYFIRAADILIKEDVEFDEELLSSYTEKTYPDLRKCIGLLQNNTINGVLSETKSEDSASKDYLLDMVSLFQKGKFLEARKLIVSQAQVEEYNEIFRFFYENLNIWGDDQDIQDEALLIIRKGLVNHALVADPEINLSATLIELTRLNKG